MGCAEYLGPSSESETEGLDNGASEADIQEDLDQPEVVPVPSGCVRVEQDLPSQSPSDAKCSMGSARRVQRCFAHRHGGSMGRPQSV